MRKIGKRVIQTCEAIESLGTATCNDVVKITWVPSSNQGKYIYRAVAYGLVVKLPHKGRGNGGNPQKYQIVPNWRDMLVKEKKVPVVVKPRIPNSVFQLGALL